MPSHTEPVELTQVNGPAGPTGPQGPTGSGVAAPATNGRSPVSRGSAWQTIGAVQGADIADVASTTVNPSGGVEYWIPAATLSANRIIILGVTGVNATYGGPRMAFIREDATANTETFKDDAGTVLYVSAAGTLEVVVFDYDKDLAHYYFVCAIPITFA
jgi:hypothetical protein